MAWTLSLPKSEPCCTSPEESGTKFIDCSFAQALILSKNILPHLSLEVFKINTVPGSNFFPSVIKLSSAYRSLTPAWSKRAANDAAAGLVHDNA